MNLYHCPYCSPKHQNHIQDKDGILICDNCGDPLIKKNPFKLNRVISLIVATAFITPLLIIIASVINNLNQKTPQNDRYSLSLALIIGNNSFISSDSS